jgi:hypothetical protein
MRNILNNIGLSQPRTPLSTINLTTFGIVSIKMKQQRLIAIDMRFYCLKDREAQNQFIMFWAPGKLNLGKCAGASPKHQNIVPTRQSKVPYASPTGT